MSKHSTNVLLPSLSSSPYISLEFKKMRSLKTIILVTVIVHMLCTQIPGTPKQRWRCCQLLQQAQGKAPPARWPVKTECQSTSRNPWKPGPNSRPPGFHPDPPKTWSPPMGQRDDPQKCTLHSVVPSTWHMRMAKKLKVQALQSRGADAVVASANRRFQRKINTKMISTLSSKRENKGCKILFLEL